MAATLDSSAAELARSLPQEDIPAKLRCANCNKLAIDAVRLPCCDQSLCLSCSQELSDACPVCSHSPVSPADCKPNKSLRTTVKAFLKTQQAKRGKGTDTPVVQSVEAATPAVAPSETPAPAATQLLQPEEDNAGAWAAKQESEVPAAPAAEESADAQGSLQRTDDGPKVESGAQTAQDEDEEEDEDDIVITTERPPEELEQAPQHGGEEEQGQQAQMDDQQHNTDFSQFNNQQDFSNMGNFNGGAGGMNGFNPMMNMGMPGFGGMGMPNMMGMGMDPSMMQMMMNGGGGGFGGMGDMSAMMNMGMGGMGGFGGMPNMGMGPMGGMGGFNGGPKAAGFNNQNFGNPNFAGQNNFRNRGFDRPYGRGRGSGAFAYARGRGGYGGANGFQNGFGGPQQQQNFGQNQPIVNQQQQSFDQQDVSVDGQSAAGGRRGSPVYEPMRTADGAETSVQPRDQDAKPEGDGTNDAERANSAAVDGGEVKQSVEEGDAPGEGNQGEHATLILASSTSTETLCQDTAEDGTNGDQHVNGDAPMPIQSVTDDSMPPDAINGMDNTSALHGAPPQDPYYYDQQQGYQQGFGGFGPRGRGGFRGGRGGFIRGRGGFNNFGPGGGQTEATDLTPTPAPPVNAPSGPKAMREGKPNTGWYSRPLVPAAVAQTPSVVATPARMTSQPAEKDAERGREYSRERSRSRQRHRSRRHTHRGESEGYESEESRLRRKDKERRRRERKREEKYDDEDDGGVDGDASSRKEGRSRDESRSSRHRDTKDDEYRASRSHRDQSKERRRRRHRSRSPEKEAAANGDVDERSRRKSKGDRKYDDEYDEPAADRAREKDRSSRKHSRRDEKYDDVDRSTSHRHNSGGREKTKLEADDEVGFKIKGSKSASLNPSGMAPPPAPSRRSHGNDRRNSRRASDAASETPTHAAAAAAASPSATADPYAEEREKRHQERMLKEAERSQRRHGGASLGKRMSRDEEDGGDAAPRGPRGDAGKRVKGNHGSGRKERRISVRYEDELPR
ncbi:hypothetical protein LTR85_005072 [Meristemomyces frigidus]|nr:hypothetical protein LTR85_005072 [Meristemomyces frigidus]